MIKLERTNSILYIGGLAMKADELNSLAGSLKGLLDHQSLAFDNINVGNGPRFDLSGKSLSITDQALHQWSQVDQALGPSNNKISIFGISMGGMIAATMAYLKPDRVSHLILAATTANLSEVPAVPEELYSKWTKARTAEELWEAVAIAFGKTAIAERPNILKRYFEYRASGSNSQKAKEFISQVNSIRDFDGDNIYSSLAKSNIKVTVLSGEEDILFESKHAESIKSKLENATFKTLTKTGHMLHLENEKILTEYVYEALIR